MRKTTTPLWEQFLRPEKEVIVAPWVGGPEVFFRGRTFKIKKRRPRRHGWHRFEIDGGRVALWKGQEENPPEGWDDVGKEYFGYLVGNRLVPDTIPYVLESHNLCEHAYDVHMVERGLDRFTRARVIHYEEQFYVFSRQEFPVGPEMDVQNAYRKREDSILHISGVTPALASAFRLENWIRDEQEEYRRRIREEFEKRIQEEEEERRKAELRQRLDTGAGRRLVAQEDSFEQAARAALAVTDAKFLDCREGVYEHEMCVEFEIGGRMIECTVHKRTLAIIDSGICLTDHNTDFSGDTLFTLESLPAVVLEAIDLRKLVIYRGRDDDRW